MNSYIKAQGAKITINFTEDITSSMAADNSSAFAVSGQEYRFVGIELGPLFNTTYEVESVGIRPPDPEWTDDEETGIFTNTEFVENKLQLTFA